jgi:DNA-directed RNA polymerase alpha subunit
MLGKPGRPRKSRENPAVAFWKGEGLSTRVANALAKGGVCSWKALGERSLDEIAGFPNLGPKSLREIEEAARTAGVRFPLDAQRQQRGS